jgi:uncharacterized protein YkwD
MNRLIFLLSISSFFQVFAQETTAVEIEIFNKINSYREEIGKSKLTYVTSKVESCRSHSRNMGITNYLEHVKSLSQVGANAEIIQMNYTDGRTNEEIAIDVLEIFIDSQAHKKIIEGGYTQISVGIFITADEDLWVTIRFT